MYLRKSKPLVEKKTKKKNIEKKSFFLSRFMAWKSRAQPVRQSCLLFTSCLCWPFLWSSTFGHIQFSSPIKANSESSFQRVFLLPRLFSFCCISIYLCQLCSSWEEKLSWGDRWEIKRAWPEKPESNRQNVSQGVTAWNEFKTRHEIKY